ncbi:hypothetical protein EBZ39_15890 [bacterium]|nr:hypothetical protein [bacterium]
MNKTTFRATLVESSDSDFEDMVDSAGTLCIKNDAGYFLCGGDSIEFTNHRASFNGNTVKVKTKIGNTFVFELNSKRDVDDVLHNLQDAAEILKLMGYDSASISIYNVVEEVAELAGV